MHNHDIIVILKKLNIVNLFTTCYTTCYLTDSLCSDFPDCLNTVFCSFPSLLWGSGGFRIQLMDHTLYRVVMSLWSLNLEQLPAFKNMSYDIDLLKSSGSCFAECPLIWISLIVKTQVKHFWQQCSLSKMCPQCIALGHAPQVCSQ